MGPAMPLYEVAGLEGVGRKGEAAKLLAIVPGYY